MTKTIPAEFCVISRVYYEFMPSPVHKLRKYENLSLTTIAL
jgi:hypothetical protein